MVSAICEGAGSSVLNALAQAGTFSSSKNSWDAGDSKPHVLCTLGRPRPPPGLRQWSSCSPPAPVLPTLTAARGASKRARSPFVTSLGRLGPQLVFDCLWQETGCSEVPASICSAANAVSCPRSTRRGAFSPLDGTSRCSDTGVRKARRDPRPCAIRDGSSDELTPVDGVDGFCKLHAARTRTMICGRAEGLLSADAASNGCRKTRSVPRLHQDVGRKATLFRTPSMICSLTWTWVFVRTHLALTRKE